MSTVRLQRCLVTHAQHILQYQPLLRVTRLQLAGLRRFSTKPIRRTSASTTPQFERIDHSYVVDEETLPGYKPEDYYPVKLGEVLHKRYKIIAKLGFGTKSTVWLCRDLQEVYDYVAVKVCINYTFTVRELDIYKEIKEVQTDHGGQECVRKMYDFFEVQGPHGFHICLVLQPLGTSLGNIKQVTSDGLLKPNLVRQTMRRILNGLGFLHKEAEVIHTDLQPSNMLLGIEDVSALATFEKWETESPCARKELDDRTIYLLPPFPLTKGPPCITDLSEARFGDSEHTDLIMPDVYRAPEVILGLPWSYPVDIWGFAMVVWDLFQPTRMFSNQKGPYSEAEHLAEMISVMGAPPLDFLQRSEKARTYWEEDGTWKNLAPIPDTSLEQLDRRTEGEENKLFMKFMRKMLQWKPEDRQDCGGVFEDEWLQADLIASAATSKND